MKKIYNEKELVNTEQLDVEYYIKGKDYANVLNKKFLNYGDTIFKFSFLDDIIQKT